MNERGERVRAFLVSTDARVGRYNPAQALVIYRGETQVIQSGLGEQHSVRNSRAFLAA
jgi:hypothetical protein